ncbi:MAG: hypothetical protein LBB63_00515 [Holosporaceae bacterium]|jgi:hypothetical protein|nr:hypothetical protein [Holosporaceae bacterium]
MKNIIIASVLALGLTNVSAVDLNEAYYAGDCKNCFPITLRWSYGCRETICVTGDMTIGQLRKQEELLRDEEYYAYNAYFYCKCTELSDNNATLNSYGIGGEAFINVGLIPQRP